MDLEEASRLENSGILIRNGIQGQAIKTINAPDDLVAGGEWTTMGPKG